MSPSGASVYEIPIAVAPGVKGIQPNLAMVYNSQGGNGLLGVGWSLKGLSAISRCGSNIATDGVKGGVYLDGRDKFCLDGQRLINIGGSEYRTQTETWQKIVATGGTASDPDHFVVYTKNGKTLEYGASASGDSRIEASGTDVAHTWLLNRVSDESGNYYSVIYTEERTIGDYRPARIEYGGNNSGPVGSVYFSYSPRNDSVTRYQGGSELTTSKLLSRITTLNGGYTYREYSLSYEYAPSTHRPRLTSVQECGSDGVCHSPTTFNWSASSTGFSGQTWSGSGTWSSSGHNYLGDFNGDGKMDIVSLESESSTDIYVRYSNGSGFSSSTYRVPGPLGASNLTWTGDFNGDGITDIASVTWPIYFAPPEDPNTTINIKVLLFSESGVTQEIWPTDGYWSNSPKYIGTGDFNGDGKTDIASGSGNAVYVRLSTGSGFNRVTWSVDNAWGDRNYTWAGDFNGDGKTDIASGNGGQVYVKESTGSGFSNHTWAVSSNWAPPSSTWAGDFNGDGLTDIASASGGSVYVKICTGTGFVSESWTVEDSWGGEGYSRVADFNGDGMADIASASGGSVFLKLSTGEGMTSETWSVADSWSVAKYTWVGDFDGNGHADLVSASGGSNFIKMNNLDVVDQLASITNGLGSTITTEYSHLVDSSVYQSQSSGGYPIRDVIAPFYVVASHSSDNGIGGVNTTHYEYGGLKYHLTGSRNLGFASIKSTDEQTGAVSTTFYDQDYDTARIGLPNLSTTVVGGCEIYRKSITWQGVSIANGTKEVYKQSETERHRELNGCQEYNTVTTTYSNYEYGSPKITGIVYGDGYSQTTVSNFYPPDEANWVIAKLENSQLTATAPGNTPITRTSAFEYDAAGRLTKEIIEPGNASLSLTTTYGHDAFGNRTSATTSGAGVVSRTTTTDYSSTNGRFPGTVTNALGHSEIRTYDPVTGRLSSLKGPNNLETVWGYDGFGRKVYEGRADGTSTSIAYFPCPSGCAYFQLTVTSGAPGTLMVYDSLNRKVRTSRQAFTPENWIHTDFVHDELGRIVAKSLPHKDTDTPLWTVMAYDLAGRVVAVAEPGNRVSTTTYNGFTTTSTNPLYQTVIKTKNSQGKVVTVTDAAGSQYYEYDAFGNLTKVTDPMGNVSTMTYDRRGRKVAINDPDMGTWSYEYNALGELTKQTDAKGQVTASVYDKLGRLVSRTIPEGTSTWTYDVGSKAIGKLSSVNGFNSTSQNYAYDDVGRPSSVTRSIGADSLTVSYTYDSFGRIATTSYPSGMFKTSNVYTNSGYLWQILAGPNADTLYWQAEDMDVYDRVTKETYGNGIYSERMYDGVTGHLDRIFTQATAGQVQDLSYEFDAIGNLEQRTDNRLGLIESFTYDSLNRLTGVSGPSVKSFQYDAIGNLTYKSDVGSYTYTGAGGPHAVASINGSVTTSFTYDANGNMLTGNGRDLTWASFNKPTQVGHGGNVAVFRYDADYERVRKETVGSITLYFDKLYERHTTGIFTNHKHYVYADKRLVAIYEKDSANETRERYVHTDHLGSIESITDLSQQVVERLSFDAHGQRRNPDWTDAAATITSSTGRGFTGHEMDDEVGLVNMNARLYDPIIGRFLSADTVIQFPETTQGYNRYTYVNNNPLSFTDPSGHFIDLLIGKFLGDLVAEYVADALLELGLHGATGLSVSTIETIGTMVGGATTAYVTSGGDPETAWQAAFFIGISAGVSSFAQDHGFIENTIVHGIEGGAINLANGGSFEDGFLGGALGYGASEYVYRSKPKSLNTKLAGVNIHITNAKRYLAEGLDGGIQSYFKGKDFFYGFIDGSASAIGEDTWAIYKGVRSIISLNTLNKGMQDLVQEYFDMDTNSMQSDFKGNQISNNNRLVKGLVVSGDRYTTELELYAGNEKIAGRIVMSVRPKIMLKLINFQERGYFLPGSSIDFELNIGEI